MTLVKEDYYDLLPVMKTKSTVLFIHFLDNIIAELCIGTITL